MRHRKIYGWMAGVSMLMLALVCIQVLWLRRAAAIEQRETDARIHRAIAGAQEELERSISCLSAYSKTFVGSDERFFILRQRFDTASGAMLRTDTVSMVYDLSASRPDTIIRDRMIDFRYPVSLELKMDFRFPVNDTELSMLRQAAGFSAPAPRSYRDVLRNNLGITSLIDPRHADTLLRNALQGERLPAGDFGFGFVEEGDRSIAHARRVHDSAALLRSPYSVPLFRENRFLKTYRMAVIFPAQAFAGGLQGWLLSSIGIIVLLFAACTYFVRQYLKQTRLAEMQTDFINNLTHEFNTPMANIALAVETLNGNGAAKDPKVARILSIISSESHRLRENIERTLQVASIERGRLQLQREPLDLVPLVNTILAGYQSQCAQLGGSITFTHSRSAMVCGDEVHLLNCICHLLDNALKYRNGRPCISIGLRENAGELQLSVADKGIGMSAETQRHIFEKFYRAHQGDVHNTTGFGLGLNYVQGIVGMHGGRIVVRSRPGIGSTFIVHLPKWSYGKAGTHAAAAAGGG